MNAIIRHTNGLTVCHLGDLTRFEACIVVYLRLWSEGPDGQAEVRDDVSAVLGPDRAGKILQVWEQLITVCDNLFRRPLINHNTGSAEVSADEASFARLITTSVEGEREDALLIALWLVRPDFAPMLIDLTTQFGLAIKRMLLCAAPSNPFQGFSSDVMH